MSYINELFSLQGKVAAVIGGSGVLGGEMAQALSEAGAKTAVMYGSSKDDAGERAKQIQDAGGTAMITKADVRDESSLRKAFKEINDQWGRIDILVNAPGVNSTTDLMEITEEEWYKILDINMKGVFLASRIAAEYMIDKGEGGSIINITSASSEIPLTRVFTYSISKAGIDTMTRYMAREWAPHNIRVNAIKPGFFPAQQNRDILDEERVESIMRHTPVKRFGRPEELSGTIVWLASEKAASFVTGAIVAVDGGFTAMSI
ncbi:SDR family oxidoreductase [Rhodohalobacter sulfatireducens]|uniref:SDR family oxidoreductase n=1 Tax=Rhodohalobacter sulfatireducens TaxID=2911366 RepID=A0ABS9KHG2_9BACT|nr:SDR family oxidoreductase [Rhodohalobacter sulfatireducens]MCG2590299.1 SDR family oxidoreductase [Rhodohalobacter sulfatireducens]